MKAMLLSEIGADLELVHRDRPVPGPSEILLEVEACGVCRTDLHLVDGELSDYDLPVIPGHQIVGRVRRLGDDVADFSLDQRVGVPWLGKTCGACEYCDNGRENLCDNAQFTGCHRDGGYAEWTVADAQFCFPVSDELAAVQVAPLLCAGLIGWRSLRICGAAERIGFYGFGAAAHILCQAAVHQGREVYGFTRPGDAEGQDFARELGAVWAGGSDEDPPQALDAAIIFAPVGELVVTALRAVKKGCPVVCAGIHMSDIPSFPYAALWGERRIQSVANLTRRDGEEFLEFAAKAQIETTVSTYPLGDANQALDDLRQGRLTGAAVLAL